MPAARQRPRRPRRAGTRARPGSAGRSVPRSPRRRTRTVPRGRGRRTCGSRPSSAGARRHGAAGPGPCTCPGGTCVGGPSAAPAAAGGRLGIWSLRASRSALILASYWVRRTTSGGSGHVASRPAGRWRHSRMKFITMWPHRPHTCVGGILCMLPVGMVLIISPTWAIAPSGNARLRSRKLQIASCRGVVQWVAPVTAFTLSDRSRRAIRSTTATGASIAITPGMIWWANAAGRPTTGQGPREKHPRGPFLP
jgi:hypothetical protein